MPFNHYARMKQIINQRSDQWIIKRINQPTHAKNFKGETVYFTHYYRIYSDSGEQIKYCKFQQIERLAKILETPVECLPIIE